MRVVIIVFLLFVFVIFGALWQFAEKYSACWVNAQNLTADPVELKLFVYGGKAPQVHTIEAESKSRIKFYYDYETEVRWAANGEEGVAFVYCSSFGQESNLVIDKFGSIHAQEVPR